MKHDAIAVIDFGGQYAHLIATKIRRLNVLAEIRQPEDPVERFEKYKGIIFSGSPDLSSHGEDASFNDRIFDLDIPILGFCYGHQEVAKRYGGEVVHGGREWGPAQLHIVRDHPLFKGLDKTEPVWMSHFDTVSAIGDDFEELGYSTTGAHSEPNRFAAIGSDKLRRWGFQFHPEVDDTLHGQEILSNYVVDICGCRPSWTMDRYLEDQIERIRQQVDGKSVFLLISGGVDSSVAAQLFSRALGPDRLCLLHVDNGLMRHEESRRVLASLRGIGLGDNLHFIDATTDFLTALDDLVEPEKKREAIGNTFIEVFQREAKKLGIENHLLGQGTIYPDTIETGGTKRADTIKTHHNRVPLIEEMITRGLVVEPLADLYKVEVRELGGRLGLPREMLDRHPFPGPGLGVRLLCSTGEEPSDDISTMTAELAPVAGPFALQAMALPARSVGVKGDLRTYEHPVMFSGEARWETLLNASSAAFREVSGINRCIWNLGPTHPRETKPLRATVTDKRLALLRQADHAVMEGLKRYGIYNDIWQCPTVLIPLQLDGKGSELVVIRPIYSKRAMTAVAAELPGGLLDDLRREILSLPEVSGLALDLTSKPPGTIEWE